MKLNRIVIEMLSGKAKIDVTTKAGAAFLRNDIEVKTGEALSFNTIKRLVGILPYGSSPREITLDIIAKYLGYDNWRILNSKIQNKISDFNVSSDFINLHEVPINVKIVIKWKPDRIVHMVHRGDSIYSVLKSENSKLREGDQLFLSQISVGFPFMAKEVMRKGQSLGNYIAAQDEGISSIEVING